MKSIESSGSWGPDMQKNVKYNIVFMTYIVSVLILAVIYFTVPERKDFIEFQIKWWREFYEALVMFF